MKIIKKFKESKFLFFPTIMLVAGSIALILYGIDDELLMMTAFALCLLGLAVALNFHRDFTYWITIIVLLLILVAGFLVGFIVIMVLISITGIIGLYELYIKRHLFGLNGKISKIVSIMFFVLAIIFFITIITEITELIIDDYRSEKMFIENKYNQPHTNYLEEPYMSTIDKPVIYLYPQQKQEVNVELEYEGKLTATYPKYNEDIKGWSVETYPDGHLINKEDNKEYSYLFWEGNSFEKKDWDVTTGFVVKGEDTRDFLQEKLSEIGLIPKEYNEFIVYWYPKMKDNKYNLIHFAGKTYTETAPLTITPQPDAMLRVFMVYEPLDTFQNIEPQTFPEFKRNGFAVVEWGGSELK